MNWDQMAGSWKQLKGSVMQFWGAITHDEFGVMMGKHTRIDGRTQRWHGVNKEEAKKQLAAWMAEHQLLLRSTKH